MEGYVFKLEGDPVELISELFDERPFWFAWNELKIKLPSPLDDPAEAAREDWDLVRVFDDGRELRIVKRSERRSICLLTEEPSGRWELIERLPIVEEGMRVLWGGRMRLGLKEMRGVVGFPRPLEYGVDVPLERPVVARVFLYMDRLMRLRYVRYARIEGWGGG